jgi:hypothetical protein
MASSLDRMFDAIIPAAPSHLTPRLELVPMLVGEAHREPGDRLSQTYLPTEVCNSPHSVELQLCRWLLRTLDRLSANQHTLTQATAMLGLQRNELTEAANKLQQVGFIRNRRGHVTVLDHTALADYAQHALEQNMPASQFFLRGISICRT